MKNFFSLLLLSVCIATYSYGQNNVREDNYMSYDSNGFPIQEKKTLSNGDTAIENTVYACDLTVPSQCPNNPNDPTTGAAVQTLINKNMLNVPIEKYTVIKKTNGTSYVTAATAYEYGRFNNYPAQMWQLESQTPQTNFTPVTISTFNCGYDLGSNFALEESYNKYDVYGNLLEETLKGGTNKSFIYSYKGAYKIAEVVNASNAQIAYTSFETVDTGYWSYSPAGKIQPLYATVAGKIVYFLNTGGAVSKHNLPRGNYIVSFWFNTNNGINNYGTQTVHGTNGGSGAVTQTVRTGATINGWTYYEYTLSNITDVDITGTGVIDEVRLYPVSAEMETYNYKPLLGYDYTCDISNHITYYQYDDQNRIKTIKDQDGNIIKKYEYGLQQHEQ